LETGRELLKNFTAKDAGVDIIVNEIGNHLSIRDVERFLLFQPPSLRELALELRDLVLTAVPQAAEVLRWKGLVYFRPELGGPVRGSLCLITLHKDHVRLGFIHGAFLPDPSELLQSEGRKYKRFVALPAGEEPDWEALRDLVTAAAIYDPAGNS
jgi:hypothetical protein